MIKRLAVFLTAILMSHTSLALTDEERAALHHIYQELVALEHWIDRAENAAHPDSRQTFHYPQLRAELQAIAQGIDDAANRQRREPRSLPPIQGAY